MFSDVMDLQLLLLLLLLLLHFPDNIGVAVEKPATNFAAMARMATVAHADGNIILILTYKR
jgi:hypothetical protein